MPLPIIPKSLYPLVPNVAGVPALIRNAATIFDTLTFGVLGLSSLVAAPIRWGVFDKNGDPIATFDNVLSVDARDSCRVSNYPIENASFKSYNKVENPLDIRIVITRGGTEEQRTEFIAAIGEAKRSLDLVTVVTPEVTYESLTIEAFDYARQITDGAGMIKAILTLVEVRQIAAANYSQPKSVSAADPRSTGQVQTVDDPSIDVRGFA